MGKGGQHHTPAALPPGKSPRPVWLVRKISPPTGFDPRTAQPVASHYTNYAIPAHLQFLVLLWKCLAYMVIIIRVQAEKILRADGLADRDYN